MKLTQTIATCLGNTLEWFDFGLFMFMAPLIGAHFFPQQSQTAATLDALLVFAAGFICRPLGGILFGHLGDTHGRASTLRISILMITLSTLLIGILPSYSTIGIFATIIFVLIRLAQGISVGGEFSGAMIYLVESAPEKKRGFISSFAGTGANLGFLLATLFYAALKLIYPATTISAWAWRIPFIFLGVFGCFILYFRFNLAETNIYTTLQQTRRLSTQPLITAMKHARANLVKIVCLTAPNAVFYYVFFGYMPTYLHHYIGLPLQTALIIQGALLAAMLILVPLAGILGDHITRKKVLLVTYTSTMLLTPLCFYLIHMRTLPAILCAWALATLLSSLEQGNSIATVVENCPENLRYSGIAFSYNIALAFFGGTAPLVVTLLIEKINAFAPVVYICLMMGISLLTAMRMLGSNECEPAIVVAEATNTLSEQEPTPSMSTLSLTTPPS